MARRTHAHHAHTRQQARVSSLSFAHELRDTYQVCCKTRVFWGKAGRCHQRYFPFAFQRWHELVSPIELHSGLAWLFQAKQYYIVYVASLAAGRTISDRREPLHVDIKQSRCVDLRSSLVDVRGRRDFFFFFQFSRRDRIMNLTKCN